MLKQISRVSDATLLITLADMKTHLQVEHTSDDTYITGLMQAAIEYIENETARDFQDCTWDEILTGFPKGNIELRRPPLKTVTSVTYFDADGTSQTMDAADYIVITPHKMPGYISKAPNVVWPTTQDRANAVTVRYTTGYTTVPAALVHAVKLLVGAWYDNREAEIAGTITSEIKLGVQRLIDQLAHGGYH